MLSMPIQSLPPPALCSPSNRRGRAPPRSFWANFVGSVDERVAKLRPGRIARERCHVGFGGGDLPVLQAVTEGSISRLVIHRVPGRPLSTSTDAVLDRLWLRQLRDGCLI